VGVGGADPTDEPDVVEGQADPVDPDPLDGGGVDLFALPVVPELDGRVGPEFVVVEDGVPDVQESAA
jgi:hypothetical protein